MELGLEASLLSPPLPLLRLLLLWVGGQGRKGEGSSGGGVGVQGGRVQGSSPLTWSWKESWASASSWKTRTV